MSSSYRRRAGLTAAVGLAIPVATTLYYMQTLGGPSEPGYAGIESYFTERWSDIVTVWLTESVGFLIGAVAAFGLAAERGSERAAWLAVALGSLGGLISTGIGIGTFQGFGTAGEENLPLFVAVLTGSFWFFFVGKALTGIGVAGLGWALARSGGVVARVVGAAAVLSGLVALVVNLVASARGLQMTFPGGATGVVATAVGAVTAYFLTRSASAGAEEGAE